MELHYTERNLVRKLIIAQHLNVPERRALTGGMVRYSMLLCGC